MMAGLACLYGLIAHGSIWYPVNLLAGVVIPSIGHETDAQLQMFDGFAFGAAFARHVVISMLIGVLYAVLLPTFPKFAVLWAGILWAGILMPVIWSSVIATVLNLVNPTLNEHISWPWFVACQLGFGLAGATSLRTARAYERCRVGHWRNGLLWTPRGFPGKKARTNLFHLPLLSC